MSSLEHMSDGVRCFHNIWFQGGMGKTLGILDRRDVMIMGLGTDRKKSGRKSGETSSALGKENTSV